MTNHNASHTLGSLWRPKPEEDVPAGIGLASFDQPDLIAVDATQAPVCRCVRDGIKRGSDPLVDPASRAVIGGTATHDEIEGNVPIDVEIGRRALLAPSP